MSLSVTTLVFRVEKNTAFDTRDNGKKESVGCQTLRNGMSRSMIWLADGRGHMVLPWLIFAPRSSLKNGREGERGKAGGSSGSGWGGGSWGVEGGVCFN